MQGKYDHIHYKQHTNNVFTKKSSEINIWLNILHFNPSFHACLHALYQSFALFLDYFISLLVKEFKFLSFV